MRKTIQAGYIRKHRGWWEVRYRERVGMGGHIRTVHRAKRLCRVDEHHKTKKSVQDLAAEELQLINSGQHSPESVTTLGDFIERVYLPNVKATKRPSTYKGYQDLYQYHIEKRCASVWLRDVRTCDVQKWLHTFAGEDKNGAGEPICKTTLKHIKHFLGGVFRYAQQLDFFDSARPNPVHAASIPAHAPDGKEGQPYMPEEVERMLEVLLEPAATIVAVAAWTGLRRGEIRGMTWEAYSLAEDSESLGGSFLRRPALWYGYRRYTFFKKSEPSGMPVTLAKFQAGAGTLFRISVSPWIYWAA